MSIGFFLPVVTYCSCNFKREQINDLLVTLNFGD